jgi:hypothetical protein
MKAGEEGVGGGGGAGGGEVEVPMGEKVATSV